jgi:hypothetical protein
LTIPGPSRRPGPARSVSGPEPKSLARLWDSDFTCRRESKRYCRESRQKKPAGKAGRKVKGRCCQGASDGRRGTGDLSLTWSHRRCAATISLSLSLSLFLSLPPSLTYSLSPSPSPSISLPPSLPPSLSLPLSLCP